jgi:hypothetical protein
MYHIITAIKNRGIRTIFKIKFVLCLEFVFKRYPGNVMFSLKIELMIPREKMEAVILPQFPDYGLPLFWLLT